MIGSRIKEKRMQIGISLRQLARDTELTASYISQLERNLIEPSIASLRKISNVLGVPLYYFLMDEQKSHMIIKSSERKKLYDPDSPMKIEFLSPMSSDKDFDVKMVTILFRVQPHSKVSEKPLVHDGDESIYIMKGKMKLILDSKEYLVEPGDSIYIKSNIPHDMINETEEEIIGISNISPSIY